MRLWLATLAAVPLLTAQDIPLVAPAEPAVTGSVDLGYRWRSGPGGNSDAYRSVVNLGEGPKLFGLDLTIQSRSRRWFDRIDLRATDWGGDPYNSARLDVTRHGWYNLSVDYRNIAYYNFLPSFADPTIARGIFLNQRSFDTHRRMSNAELELRPGKRIVPYLAYSHDSGFGTGITDFVSDANEYPVANRLRDKTDNYRGGVRFELPRFHMTLEQGGTTFQDDQQVFTSDQNSGNRTTPFLGQQLMVTRLDQAYGIRGTSIYSKVLVTASPASWADVTGQFLYSRPQTDVNYFQSNSGQFFNLDSLLFFNSQIDLLTAAAKQPHTSASFGLELRPVRRLRIVESLLTDRLHNASAAQLNQQFVAPPGPTQLGNFTDRLVWNYNQQQIEVLFDLTPRLTVRGGHRYVWGDTQTRGGLISGLDSQSGELRRQAGLAGLNYHATQSLSFNVDFEGASSDRSYFRTSLRDYRKARLRGRYQVSPSLALSAAFSILENQNPAPTVNYDFQSRDGSLSVLWTPGGGKRVSVSGDYTRSTLRSDISYIVPQTLDSARSFYRDNAHIASGVVDFVIPGSTPRPLRLSLGGSFFTSSGSRPTAYYQPLMRFTAPFGKQLTWYAEWRWYGMSQPFFLYEGFRTHLFVTGFRLSR